MQMQKSVTLREIPKFVLELEDELQRLQNENLTKSDKMKLMEEQRKSLVEKSELMQEQLVGYQGQLTRKKQLLENLEEKHIERLSQLENEVSTNTSVYKEHESIAQPCHKILQYKDEIKMKMDTISSLKETLAQTKEGEDKNWTDQIELKKEIQDLKRKQKLMLDENGKLKEDNKIKINEIKKKEKQIVEFQNNVETLQTKLRKKDELRAIDLSQLNDESEVIRKLQRSINKYQHEVELRSVQGEAISQKNRQQEKRIQELERECKKLTEELSSKQLYELEAEGIHPSRSESMKKILSQNEEKHLAEISGMKEQIISLTKELHQRDTALAEMSEKAMIVDKELRELSTKLDKKDAEMEVSDAQLEALRLENRHLRETSMDEQLSSTADLRMFENHLTEMKNANARVVAQLENENQSLQHELENLREERTMQQSIAAKQSSPQSNDDMTRVSALQDQLELTEKKYEDQIEQLIQQSSSHEDRSMPQDESMIGKSAPSHRLSADDATQQDTNGNSNDEMDFSHLFDFLEENNLAGGRNSRRQSATREFINEEKRREEELRNLLQSRISDLENKTKETLQKHLT
eukprot:gene11345-12527_t